MATKTIQTTITQEEPVAGDITAVVIAGRDEADPGTVNIHYKTKDNQGKTLEHNKTLSINFDSLTAGQQNTIRTIMSWALNQVTTAEGPFV